jgi:hypothetical protein
MNIKLFTRSNLMFFIHCASSLFVQRPSLIFYFGCLYCMCIDASNALAFLVEQS